MKANIKTFDLTEAFRISGVNPDDFIAFYLIRGYIRKESYGYSATVLGIEKGCFVNDNNCNALMTIKGICKVGLAFSA